MKTDSQGSAECVADVLTKYWHLLWSSNPLSPTSDQDRISPHTISIIPSRHVMRIKKISIRGLLVDPIPNSPK